MTLSSSQLIRTLRKQRSYLKTGVEFIRVVALGLRTYTWTSFVLNNRRPILNVDGYSILKFKRHKRSNNVVTNWKLDIKDKKRITYRAYSKSEPYIIRARSMRNINQVVSSTSHVIMNHIEIQNANNATV